MNNYITAASQNIASKWNSNFSALSRNPSLAAVVARAAVSDWVAVAVRDADAYGKKRAAMVYMTPPCNLFATYGTWWQLPSVDRTFFQTPVHPEWKRQVGPGPEFYGADNLFIIGSKEVAGKPSRDWTFSDGLARRIQWEAPQSCCHGCQSRTRPRMMKTVSCCQFCWKSQPLSTPSRDPWFWIVWHSWKVLPTLSLFWKNYINCLNDGMWGSTFSRR